MSIPPTQEMIPFHNAPPPMAGPIGHEVNPNNAAGHVPRVEQPRRLDEASVPRALKRKRVDIAGGSDPSRPDSVADSDEDNDNDLPEEARVNRAMEKAMRKIAAADQEFKDAQAEAQKAYELALVKYAEVEVKWAEVTCKYAAVEVERRKYDVLRRPMDPKMPLPIPPTPRLFQFLPAMPGYYQEPHRYYQPQPAPPPNYFPPPQQNQAGQVQQPM